MAGVKTPRLPAREERTRRLSDALRTARFTADGFSTCWAPSPMPRSSRGETVPALRATRGDGPLETLVRLFLLQHTVPLRARAAALRRPRRTWRTAGCCATADDVARAVRRTALRRAAAQDWWIVSDLGCAVGGAGGIGSAPGVDRAAWCSASAARPPRWPG